MRYQPAPASLFVENRRRLTASLPAGAVAILHANDVVQSNGDGLLPYVPNSDLYYLSGIDQEETILLLFPAATEPAQREMLFVRETSETIAIWEGERLSKERVQALSGVMAVHGLQEFERYFRQIMVQAQSVWLNSNEHPRAHVDTGSRDYRFIQRCRREYPLHRYERLAPLLRELRCVKSADEIDLIAEAIRITRDGFLRILNCLLPGIKEYELEAELAHEYLRQRANGFAYSPILASGANSCVLHYVLNNRECQAGDLLLMDAAARYGHYNADLTRTLPVSGRFTERQKAVYQAVLRVLRFAIAELRPGITLNEHHAAVEQCMTRELIGLGLLPPAGVDPRAHTRYYMHRTCHFLGLDVHDVGDSQRPLQAGMVLTVEPGIYIREENLGIRLENNVLITEHGARDLMADMPIEVEEIERLMGTVSTGGE